MMQPWFEQAKLGIFLHWGIYAVNGIPESWSFFRGQISHDDYMKQYQGFTADKYDPQAWADLFKRAGADYAVLTTKHHDGVALWPTQANDESTCYKSPCKDDLIKGYCDGLRDHGLHVGLYFSHLDWSHPDYASVMRTGGTPNYDEPGTKYNSPPKGQPEDPDGWERFLQFHRAQLKELCENYDPELLWFDGDWERTPEQWRMAELREQLHTWRPGVILNSRMGGHGDYLTPEQGLPIQRPDGIWEFCMTVNNSWGYQKGDDNHKSTCQLVRYFVECIGMGGKLLLDIGPYADGSLQPEQVTRLEELGAWISKHDEAVHGTQAGLPCGHYFGPSTYSADRKSIFLYFFDKPVDQIAVKGIRNDIKSVQVVGHGQQLKAKKVGGAPWMNIPGVLWIDLPEESIDPNCTVIRIDLEGELDLYSGAGQAITAN